MCATCGCSGTAPDLGHSHAHEGRPHGHSPEHGPDRAPSHGTIIRLEQAVLAKNDRLAERNRGWLEGRNILAVNLVSAPGAGKTTLLERTIRDLAGEFSFHVIEGDQATDHDARRIRAAGCPVIQINTGTGCHLDAEMVARALRQLDPPAGSVVFIENVGNLVCPALFDLGERAKVLVASVAEGDDKPAKYPHMFRASTVLLLNKIDLLPHVRFDVGRCLDAARQVNAGLRVFEVSATRGDGLEQWYGWLREQAARGLHIRIDEGISP
ncbi:MAG TPA: hydrogenase nickel incorporation protein HypB [Gemmataceae bacterium]|nr:hydrogenase nickel incorporation protein HypB [Gemmataceae bacterium]